ncbi:hypothetical protein SNK03_003894 [Fusarium graminearum]
MAVEFPAVTFMIHLKSLSGLISTYHPAITNDEGIDELSDDDINEGDINDECFDYPDLPMIWVPALGPKPIETFRAMVPVIKNPMFTGQTCLSLQQRAVEEPKRPECWVTPI